MKENEIYLSNCLLLVFKRNDNEYCFLHPNEKCKTEKNSLQEYRVEFFDGTNISTYQSHKKNKKLGTPIKYDLLPKEIKEKIESYYHNELMELFKKFDELELK